MINLEVNQLCKSYAKRTILKNLSFSWHQGILGIQGPNGSGKSTLMQCITYLLSASSGQIQWSKNDNTVIPSKELRHYIGMIAPYIELYPALSIKENMLFLSNLHAKSLDDQGIEAYLSDFQLDTLMKQEYGSLSTGQKQRAKLASALLHKPEFLLLDEASSNLDRSGIDMVHHHIQQHVAQGGKVILASNLEEELAWCDEVVQIPVIG